MVREAGEDYDVVRAIAEMEREMAEAAEAMEFERAALLRDQMQEMEKKLETEVCVVYEATGVYHRVLKKVLEDNNIKQFIINPLL